MSREASPQPGSAEARLLGLFRRLAAAEQATLLRFAEFLASEVQGRAAMPEETKASPEPERPREIPRREGENVIQALRRLRETYPMLDRRELLGPASELVTQHTVYGREADEIIEALEQLYRDRYREYVRRFSEGSP